MKSMYELVMIGLLFMGLFLFHSPDLTHAEKFPINGRTITFPDKLIADDDKMNTEETVVNLTEEDIMLEGLVDSAELYYNVPLQGMKDSSTLDINVQYSELLSDDSSLTVAIDDKPVYSEKLKLDKQAMTVQVPLTAEAATQGFHTITISFYGYISEKLCANLDNPANWLTISAKSKLFLQTDPLHQQENTLQDYPYPFVQNMADHSIQSEIVIPDKASTPVLTASLRLANYVNRQATGEEKVKITKESDLKKVSSHLIVVGAVDQWTGVIKDIYNTAPPITVSENELFINNYYMQSKSKEKLKQLMLVTALDDTTIADNISVVTEDHLIEQLAGDEITIDVIPEQPKEDIKQKHPLTEFGLTNQTLTGKQKASANFFYPLPGYTNLYEDASLQLKLKVSDTLFKKPEIEDNKEDAELVVLVNDIPYPILINDLEREDTDSFYHVDIPIESSILREAPYITIQFKAHGLHEHQICLPDDDERWVFIHEDSYLQLEIQDTSEAADFSTWPAPFGTVNETPKTTIILPDASTQTMINQLQLLTNTLGSHGSLADLNLVFEKDVNEKELADDQIIVVGKLSDHPSLQAYKDKLMIDEKDRILDVTPFQFLKETSKTVAWIQPSIWNEARTMAVFAPVHEEEADTFLSERLIDYLNSNTLDTDIVVESKNGEVFTRELDTTNTTNEASSPTNKQTVNKDVNKGLIISFIGIMIIGLLLFIYIFKKRKRQE